MLLVCTNPFWAEQLQAVLLLLSTKFVPHVLQVVGVAQEMQPTILQSGVHKLLVLDN